MNRTDYQALILDAFEKDLDGRRNNGATDALFDVNRSQHRLNGEFLNFEGMPTEVLVLCVKSIFGENYGSTAKTTWRNYRMSVAKKLCNGTRTDMLLVRLI